MKKILTVFLGGTICCSVKNIDGEKVRDIDMDNAKSVIINNFTKENPTYGNLGEELFHVSDLGMSILSENMNVEHLVSLVNHIKSFELKEFSGIIILHGTDTLAFTASFLWEVLCNINIPVILVSGNRPPMDELSNANANFKNAVELISKGIAPNVYVTYRNSDGKDRLYLGCDILQCENFSEDFRSAKEEYILDEKSIENILETSKTFEKNKREIPFEKIKLRDKKVLAIKPYTGLDYSVYNLDNISAVVHGTYHSETVCTVGYEYSVIEFAKKLKDKNIPLFLAPCSGREERYSSTDTAVKADNIIPIFSTFESAYAKCLLATLLGICGDDIIQFVTEK